VVDDDDAEIEVGPAELLGPGSLVGADRYAVGNVDGHRFAVTRRCRHLGADLAEGAITDDGCLECPWHQARYDVTTGRATRGPQGFFAKVPGLGAAFRAYTKLAPLARGTVTDRDGTIHVR
jgi:nitrite reductase/ring-hydroxylating ferredoxin subunit